MNKIVLRIVAGTALLLTQCALGADWLQSGFDAAHSGFNPLERQISPATASSLAQRFETSLPESIAGGAVLLTGVSMSAGTRDVLYLTASSGNLLALDAASGAVLWSKLAQTQGYTHSTPAVDPNRQYVYSYTGDGKVHKFRVGDGEEILDQGWPQLVTLKPNVEHGASALAIGTTADGARYLYAVTNGYMGDGGDYQGHLTTINLATGEQTVFNALCSDVPVHFIDGGAPGINDCASHRAGIWGRPGATFDAVTGRVYIVTANGDYDAAFGGFNWGDSVLALSASGQADGGVPLDSYTPVNYEELDTSDVDLGSGSLAIIGNVPGIAGRYAVVEGKDTQLRLLSLDDLSGAGGPRNVGGELALTSQSFVCKCSMPQPAVWTAPDGSIWVYAVIDGLDAYQITIKQGRPELTWRWRADGMNAYSAYSPVVANGVVFAVGYGVSLLDATTGDVLQQIEDWTLDGRRREPIVANGHLYVVTQNALKVYAPDGIFVGGFDVE